MQPLGVGAERSPLRTRVARARAVRTLDCMKGVIYKRQGSNNVFHRASMTRVIITVYTFDGEERDGYI
jgi:hypothetical protein